MASYSEDKIPALVDRSRIWSEYQNLKYSGFHQDQTIGQNPTFLWIGCSDSRVPPTVVTASRPGDIFVHLNIANQFPEQDTSAISVLTYAIQVLKIDHIVVVGHTECGGVEASYKIASGESEPNSAREELNRWLQPLIGLAHEQIHPGQARGNEGEETKRRKDELQKLVESNVRAQVNNIAKTRIVREAWASNTAESGMNVRVHGLVFDMETGRLSDLNCTVSALSPNA